MARGLVGVWGRGSTSGRSPTTGGVALAGRIQPRTPPPRVLSTAPAEGKGEGRREGKWCSVERSGRRGRKKKKEKKREQKHGGLWSVQSRRWPYLDVGPPAAPAGREPLGRQLPSLQTVPLETRPRGGAGAEGPAESRPCQRRVPRPRSRRFLTSGSYGVGQSPTGPAQVSPHRRPAQSVPRRQAAQAACGTAREEGSGRLA